MVADTKSQIEKQILMQQFNEVQEQLQKIEEQLSEIEALKQSIADFSKLKAKSELLVPLANGIFFNASLLKENELKINVGANVLVDKTPEEAIALVDSQFESLSALRDEVAQQFEALIHAIKHIEE